MRRLAMALSLLFLAMYVALYGGLAARLLPQESWPKNFFPSALWEGLFITGTLAALPLCALAGLKKPRQAGALLLLASAVASTGLSIHAGPHLWRYFTGFFIAVLPQCCIACLLLLYGRPKKAAAPKARKTRE